MKKFILNRRKNALERQKKMLPTSKGINKTLPLVKKPLKKLKKPKKKIKGVVGNYNPFIFVKSIKKTPRIEKKDYYPYIKYVLSSIKRVAEDTRDYYEDDNTNYEKFSKTQKRQLKGTRKTSTLKELKEAVLQKYNLLFDLFDYPEMVINASEEQLFDTYKDWELNILGEKRFKFTNEGIVGKGKKYLIIKK